MRWGPGCCDSVYEYHHRYILYSYVRRVAGGGG
jgi:hypothetical protein